MLIIKNCTLEESKNLNAQNRHFRELSTPKNIFLQIACLATKSSTRQFNPEAKLSSHHVNTHSCSLVTTSKKIKTLASH